MSIINKINQNSSTYIIAEIGANHLGQLNLAEKMIKAASSSGANAVKFQTFVPEEIIFKNSKDYDLIKNTKNHLSNCLANPGIASKKFAEILSLLK